MLAHERLIILVGPSGAGKSSLLERLVTENPQLVDTVTYTTRGLRDGESEGDPYHFVSREKFVELKEMGFFIEWAQVHDNYYGTPRHQIDDAWREGKTIIMDVDVQGARFFRKEFPRQAFTLFIKPPSMEVLTERLQKRDSGQTQNLQLRLENAQRELALADEFDSILVNDHFETCYHECKKMIDDLLKNH